MSAVATVIATERRKLAAQAPLWLLAVLCLLGPFAFAALLKAQSGTPSDALFGAWVHSSGYALSLVVLGFAANWGFPLLAGVLAGDLFSAEDRHGAWKTILTRSRTLGELFAGKVLVVFLLAIGLGSLLAVSSLLAGLALVGSHPLVDLGGHVLAPAHVLGLVLASWLVSLAPLLAYTSIAMLFSIAFRNGILGVIGPMIIALLSQLLALIGKGLVVHVLLVSAGFDAWHGLLAAPPFFGPLALSLLISAAWITGSLALAWRILRRREFATEPGRRRSWRLPVRVAGVAVCSVSILALATAWGPASVTRRRLTTAIASEFRRLTVIQQDLLGHPIPFGARYTILPVCNRRGGGTEGPGDWSCTMNVYVLLPGATHPLTDTPVTYDVSVQSNGCFKASSPPGYVGPAEVRDVHGRTAVNPLVTIYGCFNIL